MAGRFRFDFDNAVSGIRALLGDSPAPRVTAEIDPDVVRYLDSMARRDAAFQSRFGFDPERLYVAPDDVSRAARSMDVGTPGDPDMGIDAPLFPQLARSQDAYDNLRKGRTANLRNSGGDLARIAGQNIRAADDAARTARAAEGGRDAAYLTGGALGLAALGTGLSQMATPGTAPGSAEPEEPVLVSGGAEDLVEESRPAPSVPAEPDEPVDYSMQARAMIDQLNAMRRQAGGEVPEAAAMQKEINRLLALGNQTRRATAVAAPQDDAGRMYQQAQALIDQVNQMYRQGASQNSPQVQQLMAKVRQLQSQGDAIRNRRA
jgi:hypothetical protein